MDERHDKVSEIVRSQSTPTVGFAAQTSTAPTHTQHELFKALSFKHNPPPSRTNTASTKAINIATDMKPNLHRTFREIPFDIRERVVELVTKAERAADEAKHSQLKLNKELLNLRRDYYQTDKEVSVQLKKRDLFLNQINLNSEKLGALEDDAESRRLRVSKNAEAISRLSRTNKSLVEAFSKLYDDGATEENSDDGSTGDAVKTFAVHPKRNRNMKSDKGRRNRVHSSADEQPNQQSTASPPKPHQNLEPVVVTSNEKLRERLLQVAKEHNRVVKNVEVLEIKVEGLRSSVRFADRRNRQLKAELDELRESASIDGSTSVEALEAKAQAGGAGKEETNTNAAKKPKAQRAANTSRLNSLLAMPDFDAMDGIRHLDALLQHAVATPTNLSEKEVANHLCNRFVCHVLNAQSMCLYLVQPGGRVMHRYCTGSPEVRVMPLFPAPPSIAEWVLRRKESCVLTNPEKHHRFRADVDRPAGISAVKRLLSVPLCDLNFGAAIGALHVVNKTGQGGLQARFTAVEEKYALAYGELVGSLLASSVKFNRLSDQSQWLCSLIQAPLQLLDSAIEGTMASALCAVEETLRDALHCAHVKAYLFSPVKGDSTTFVTSLKAPPLSRKAAKRNVSSLATKECLVSPSHEDFTPSIAAYCINSRRTFLSYPGIPPHHHDYADLCPEGADYNPGVDMHPPVPKKRMSSMMDPTSPGSGNGSASNDCPPPPVFYCTPIINLQQEVIGCLQASPSSFSPLLKTPLDSRESVAVHTISFQDAMGWVGYLLSSKVTHLLSNLGQPMDRHGFFLEPLNLTQSLKHVEISLAPPEPHKYLPRSVLPADVKNQISEWNRCHESLKAISEDGGASNGDTARSIPEEDTEGTSGLEANQGKVGGGKTEKMEFVSRIRELHSTVEQLRRDAMLFKASAGARLEQKVRAELASEFDERLRDKGVEYEEELNQVRLAEEKKVMAEEEVEVKKLRGREKELIQIKEKREKWCEEQDKRRVEERRCAEMAAQTAAADLKLIAEDETVAATKQEIGTYGSQEKESDSSREADRLAIAAYERERAEAAASCWEECLDGNNEVFFFNTLTEESVWEAPATYTPLVRGGTSAEEGDAVTGDWMRMVDTNGGVYWVHEESGETHWGEQDPTMLQ